MLRTAAILVVLATLVLARDADSQSKWQAPKAQPVQTQSAPPAQTTTTDQRGTDQSPLSVKIFPAPQSKEDAERAERERHEEADGKRVADETERLAEFTGALAIATSFLFVAALAQIGLFFWQLRLIKSSADDAKTAANAAKASAEFIPLAERAYIAAIPRGVRPYHAVGNPADENIACDVGLKNVGHLAARRVAYAIRYKFCADAKLADFTSLVGACEGNVALAPGIEMKKGASPPVPKKDFASVRDAATPESSWLYVFGRVEYGDGFGKRRWMEFCFRYSLAAAGRGFNISEDDARYHEHGNSTDED